MFASLHSKTALNSAEASRQLHEWRVDTLRLFLGLITIGYLACQFSQTFPNEAALARAFSVAPPTIVMLVLTYLLLERNSQLAAIFFGAAGLGVIAWSIYALRTASIAMLFPLLALIAAFVVQPVGGFLVGVGAVALLELLALLLPDVIGPDLIWTVAVYSALAVVGVWAVMHRLFQALNWYVTSYGEAETRMQEARDHRAQLVQAYKQLDLAYYRIERASAALQIAWKAADEAERSKMELAANVSHELRTPLNLIAGYSELMITSPRSYGGISLPETFRGDMSAIYRSAQHLLALTDDVLDLARMEVGRLGLTREAANVHQIVLEAVDLVRDYVEAKGLALETEIPVQPMTLNLDRLRIRQVLLNLLANAARITERGQIRVAVEHLPTHLRVVVSDTGPGISPEDVASLFRPFSPLDRAHANWHSGTGLGLSISKRFIELHGGEMGVESTLGAGCTFWFTLPRGSSTSGDVDHRQSGQPAMRYRPAEQTVVVAHSDPRIAHLLGRRLANVCVESAESLGSAMALACDLKATLIIADIDEPASEETGPVPIVRCPLPHAGDLRERLGVDDYLEKPVSRDVLLNAVRQQDGSARKILIVDDDSRMVRMLQRMLTSESDNYVIDTAYNGEEALTKLQLRPPDLLLLDLVMPEVDGVTVLARMAGNPALAQVKTIVISARSEEESTVPLGREIGIGKPDGFRVGEVITLLQAIVEGMAPARPLVDDREPAPPVTLPG